MEDAAGSGTMSSRSVVRWLHQNPRDQNITANADFELLPGPASLALALVLRIVHSTEVNSRQ